MRELTPPIIINFQNPERIRETYTIVLKNIVDIAKTMNEKREIHEAKLLLKEALFYLDDSEYKIWKGEQNT